MPTNVGRADRIIRLIIAVAAAFAGFRLGGTVGYVLYAVAALMLVTAALGWCGIYALLGLSTCPVQRGR
ncbi:MAG: DUF2892 domain-containing protein [Thermaerobacter sp.]|nr:DUF2892 domain-containing protein [Bacillota bacterium]REJ38277.1 MAG: DUF2892 domain-containing protein [Bacillota bacterium]